MMIERFNMSNNVFRIELIDFPGIDSSEMANKFHEAFVGFPDYINSNVVVSHDCQNDTRSVSIFMAECDEKLECMVALHDTFKHIIDESKEYIINDMANKTINEFVEIRRELKDILSTLSKDSDVYKSIYHLQERVKVHMNSLYNESMNTVDICE